MLCYHVIVHCDTLPDSLHHTPHLILPIYDFMNIAQHYLVACLLFIPMIEFKALYLISMLQSYDGWQGEECPGELRWPKLVQMIFTQTGHSTCG